ncbi:hypothetical protein HKX48_003620 [Thoreauomyces humboldtii]|nr:hypothetical protein HKX48_003620 [Thoreauomyces humboldtii]
MSERKVLNKYFPPDFDPSKIPRRKLPKDAQQKVRLMTPFSMQCVICGEYIYKGKKFNARKERVEGEEYLGIQVLRFYIRCPRCSGEITFKTDPQNADYLAEHGAQRNFEPWRQAGDASEEQKTERAQAEENNPMKALENRTLDSKREMDILDALDEIRMRNAKTERVDSDGVLDGIIGEQEDRRERARRLIEEHDDMMAKAIFQGVDGESVKRILDDEDEGGVEGGMLPTHKAALDAPSDAFLKPAIKRKPTTAIDLGILVKKKAKPSPLSAPPIQPTLPPPRPPPPRAAAGPSALDLLGGTYSDSESD